MSALMLVISCNASSNDQPSARKLAISFQSSWVLTVRSPVSVPRGWTQISETLLSKASSVARCAPLQIAMAFLKICWVRANHAGLRCALSMLISGVSSKSALLTSCASVWSARDVRVVCLERALHALRCLCVKARGCMLCPHVGS